MAGVRNDHIVLGECRLENPLTLRYFSFCDRRRYFYIPEGNGVLACESRRDYCDTSKYVEIFLTGL